MQTRLRVLLKKNLLLLLAHSDKSLECLRVLLKKNLLLRLRPISMLIFSLRVLLKKNLLLRPDLVLVSSIA